MKLQTNVWLTVIMTAMQCVAQISDLLPERWKHWALASQIIFEALKALRAHFSNPDGTAAQMAYRPYPGRNPLPPGVLMLTVLLLPTAGIAQTRARPEQLGADPAPTARVLVVMPSGVVVLAHMQDLALDTTGPVPVLRASVAIASPTPRMRSLRWKVAGVEASFSLAEPPSRASLQLYRNGLLLTEGDDYTIDAAGTRVTLHVGLEARAGDIVRALYFY